MSKNMKHVHKSFRLQQRWHFFLIKSILFLFTTTHKIIMQKIINIKRSPSPWEQKTTLPFQYNGTGFFGSRRWLVQPKAYSVLSRASCSGRWTEKVSSVQLFVHTFFATLIFYFKLYGKLFNNNVHLHVKKL